MRLCILARNRFNYSNKRFRKEAKGLGIKLSIVDPSEFALVLAYKSPMLFHRGKSFAKVDLVTPRMGASINSYGLSVLAQCETIGIPVINDVLSCQQTRNKLRCIQLLSKQAIDIPKTVVIRNPSDPKKAVDAVGGFPVVMKLLSGTQGIGVMIVENQQTLSSTLDTLWSLGQDILIQECVNESIGRDVRVLVVGGKVMAAMRRVARIGEFRSNYHRGGIATQIDLTPEYEEVAIRAAKAVGLEIAGVDLLESNHGPKVIEVNASPGLEGIESCTGRNLAREMLQFCKEYAQKP